MKQKDVMISFVAVYVKVIESTHTYPYPTVTNAYLYSNVTNMCLPVFKVNTFGTYMYLYLKVTNTYFKKPCSRAITNQYSNQYSKVTN